MSNFQDAFELPQHVTLVFPEPYYEGQSEYSYPADNWPHNGVEKQSCPAEKQEVKTIDLIELVLENPGDATVNLKENTVDLAIRVPIEFSSELRQKAVKVKRGSKDDTVLLNTNFKTILVTHFKEKAFLRELSSVEIKELQVFSQTHPSFKSLVNFSRREVEGSSLRMQLVQMVESQLIARRVLESRCLLENKIQMLKFLQVFRRNVVQGSITKWKESIKKE